MRIGHQQVEQRILRRIGFRATWRAAGEITLVIHFPGLHVVAQIGFQTFADHAFLELGVQYRERAFDTAEKIPVHPVGAARPHPYPAWFAEMLAIHPTPIHTQVIANNREVGKLSLQMDARTAIENLWTLTWMFTSLCLLGMLIVGLILHRMLKANLGGLYDLQQAARRLHTVMEKLLEDISFEAGEKTGTFNVDAQLVTDRLATLAAREDLARYVL